MSMECIATDKAPAAIGPYSQAVKAGDFLFVSGQLPMDPASGELIEGSIEDKARQVLSNAQAIVQAAGADLTRVAKATVFLKDMKDFMAVNGVYAEFFQAHLPARSAIQVAGLPKGADVEVELIVYVG